MGNMSIEGVSAAMNANSTPVRQQTKVADVSAAMAGSGQIKIESVRPVEASQRGSGSSSDGAYQGDRAQVMSDKEIAPERVKSAVDDLNKQIRSNVKHTSLSFKYHDDTNRISITVTDEETDEVIREIPPEKALDMLAKAWEMAGLLVDEKR